MSNRKLRAAGHAADRLADLMERAGGSDTEAFSELYSLTLKKMRATAAAVLLKPVDLDDVVQEAFLKIWRNAGSFDRSRSSAITWMSTIVRNTALDAVKLKTLHTVEIVEAMSMRVPVDEVDDLSYALASRIASVAITRLPEDRQELFSLAYLEGASRVDLARRFGVPVGTVKTWLRRSLETVRSDCLSQLRALPAV